MRGILLVNVGTPKSCEKEDVQNFIADMLSDPLVTGRSKWLSTKLAQNIIAPLSANKSLSKYRKIWRKEEPLISPMMYYMQRLAHELETKKSIPVEISFRYGEPDFSNAIKALEKKCPLMHELVVFPLFPHYAQSTTQTVIEEIGKSFYKRAHSFRLKIVKPYYNHPAYINALVSHTTPFLEAKYDRVVFSYHSLPIKQVEDAWEKGKEFDYVYQLKETNKLVTEQLNIPANKILLFYASQRSNKWLKPFLSTDISDLPRLGWKNVLIMSPGFPVDNLETLYDIDINARRLFMEAGGEVFTYVPSLNDSEVWVEAIWKIISHL